MSEQEAAARVRERIALHDIQNLRQDTRELLAAGAIAAEQKIRRAERAEVLRRVLSLLTEEKKRCAQLCDSRGWEALEAARQRIEGEIGGSE